MGFVRPSRRQVGRAETPMGTCCGLGCGGVPLELSLPLGRYALGDLGSDLKLGTRCLRGPIGEILSEREGETDERRFEEG